MPYRLSARDLAFLTPPHARADDLLRALVNADPQTILAARVFDVYVVDQTSGTRSIGVELALAPKDGASMDAAAIDAVITRARNAAGKLGAELRE